jgi:hypothetical protein
MRSRYFVRRVVHSFVWCDRQQIISLLRERRIPHKISQGQVGKVEAAVLPVRHAQISATGTKQNTRSIDYLSHVRQLGVGLDDGILCMQRLFGARIVRVLHPCAMERTQSHERSKNDKWTRDVRVPVHRKLITQASSDMFAVDHVVVRIAVRSAKKRNARMQFLSDNTHVPP